MIYDSYTSKIYIQLKEELINSANSFNDLITEKQVAERFGLSKTPARESLNQLCIEGFLEKIPYKGYLIKKFSYYELKQLFQFRQIIELASIDLAVKQASPRDIEHLWDLCDEVDKMEEITDIKLYNDINQRFHIDIAKISQNVYLVEELTKIMNLMRRPLIVDLKLSNGKELLAPHKKIVEMIEAKNLEKAMEITKDYLCDAEKRIFEKDVFDSI